jgi:membrane protease YdiL (CAAX protease family)
MERIRIFGIDANWRTDFLIGLGVAIIFVVLARTSSLFQLGMPESVGNILKFSVNVVLAPLLEEAFFRGIMPTV